MSDYICFELQIEIIKRLPLQSLVKFKTVSKPWKSLIDSSEFMADYKHHQEPLLFIIYMDLFDTKHILILDENFCHKFSTPLPSLPFHEIVGSSHGLFCFYNFGDRYIYEPDTAILCNPLIRKIATIRVPQESVNQSEKITLGFGVCPITLDPLIVKISSFRLLKVTEYGNSRWTIAVFSLRSREWKTLWMNLPHNNFAFTGHGVAVGGYIYWCGHKRITGFLQFPIKIISLIMLFDMTSHEFREIYLPDDLANASHLDYLSISKVRESLVVLRHYETLTKEQVCDVWMMTMDDHHGVQYSFSKLYTFEPTDATPVKKVLGFTDNGAPIIEKQYDEVAVYNTNSQQMHKFSLNGGACSFSVNSYKESLLMLNLPDYIHFS